MVAVDLWGGGRNEQQAKQDEDCKTFPPLEVVQICGEVEEMSFVRNWNEGEKAMGKRLLLRFTEVTEILGCSRDHIYDLLRDGKLQAHNPLGRPGGRGTKIVASSVEAYVASGTIKVGEWTK